MQGHFPEAEKDPVIQIASLVTEQGQSKPLVRNVMTLDTCAAIVGAEVMSFDKEEDLLKASAEVLPVVLHAAIRRCSPCNISDEESLQEECVLKD